MKGSDHPQLVCGSYPKRNCRGLGEVVLPRISLVVVFVELIERFISNAIGSGMLINIFGGK